jgi:hypothetical protein
VQPRQKAALLILAVTAAGAGGFLYAHRNAPPTCGAAQTLDRVTDALRAQSQLTSIVISNIRTLSNGFFGNRYECAAAVAEIRSEITASDMHWHEIHYSSVRPGPAPLTVVSVTIGPEIPLPPPPPSWWDRLRALL